MKKRLWILAFLIFSLSAFADDWTLGVMEFSFKQTQKRAESSAKAAQVLPQLIVEQFLGENIRTIPEKEKLDRKLKELQTERLSLFLQLSKEYKTRDSLLITYTNPKKLEKEIKKQMEKIREIEEKIDTNLEEVKKAIDEASPKIERDEAVAAGKEKTEHKKEDNVFRLPFPFFRTGEEDKIITEDVVLYKSDATSLFTPSEKSVEAGFTSWDFEQEVVNAKINGLITGEITCYGDYCSVTASLRIYPGGKVFGTVREVGLLSDLMPLANSIARSLDSKIANALPVMLEFEIEPKEIARDAKIMIDGVVFSLQKTDGTFENKIIKDSGIHHINVEATDYENLAFTYSFSDDNCFLIHVNLVPEVHGKGTIRLKKYREGVFHTYGLLQAPVTETDPVASIEVNSKAVLGVFTVPKENEDDSDSSNIAFFRIPENQAFDGANLIVDAKPFDREKNIDKRRRWMYTAYTALICSLPFTFYYNGEFDSEYQAYLQQRGDKERLYDLQKKSNLCTGITAVCGIWTAVELVRYLWAADRVLPAKTKIDKNKYNPIETVEAAGKTEEGADFSAEKSVSETEATENEKSDTIETNEIFVE